MPHRSWIALLISVLVFAGTNRAVLAQNKHNPKKGAPPKSVVVLFDVSQSMVMVPDELPKAGSPPGAVARRQDRVIQFLADDKVAFVKRLSEKGPVLAYRFGARLDEDFVVFAEGRAWTRAEWENYLAKPEPRKAPAGNPWSKADWEKWLKPALKTPREHELFGGTNIGGALQQVVQHQNANSLAAVILFSDGRNNIGAAETLFIVRRQLDEAKVPLITVGVGQQLPPAAALDVRVLAPQVVPQGERFRVRVDLMGHGLAEESIRVVLELHPPGGGKAVTLEGNVLFRGKEPLAATEFALDLDNLPGGKRPAPEGEWRIVVRIPRHAKELPGPDHVREARFHVGNKPPAPRNAQLVLVPAGGEIHVELMLRDDAGKPLGAEAMPVLSVKLQGKETPINVDMTPRPKNPGFFTAKLKLSEPGDYTFTVSAKGLTSPISQSFQVQAPPNPELDNSRIDFAFLYELGSSAKAHLEPLDKAVRDAVLQSLAAAPDGVRPAKDDRRLFFVLQGAHVIPDCVFLGARK